MYLRLYNQRPFAPGATRRGVRLPFRLLLLTSLLVLAAIVAELGPGLAYASGTAPNGPGAASNWTPSNNTILGTAATTGTTSDVWFTGQNGIVGEVFYPTADTSNTTDLQFLVGSSNHTWVDEEKAATTSTAVLYNAHSLAWTVTNTATSGKYKITKTIYTDPTRNSLIQQVTFTTLTGTLSNYALYALYNPSMQNAGNNNSSSTQVYNGTTMLVTTDTSNNYASALAASIPYQSGMTSSGFVGQNDGWTDLKGSSNCGSGTCPDYTMNYTYSTASNGNTAQTGLLDLSDGGTINTATATSITFNLVLSFGQTNGSTSATSSAEQALAGTLGGNFSTMLSTYVSQWNTFDNGLHTPPAVGSTTAIKQARQQEYYLAANVLKASQDKQTGTFVAGLGTPWGDTNGDGDSGYHLVWERDMYEFSSALIVAGDTADPTRAVEWAFDTQQESDGHFPQNSYVNGTPYWPGIQMDEQAFPIILAWKLGLTDSSDFTHIKNAANYIINHGPSTGEERWEENGGYSPSTIAAEIAGLVCAADTARVNGDTTDEATWDNTADYWQGMVQNWTFTTSGSLGAGDYFERIDNNGNPNDGASITIANNGGTYDERSIVDAGFLELVREGIMPANSPYITLSLPVIDSTISETINGNQYWYRYNHDGYGENSSGANYNDTSGDTGRLWPILSGERGIYNIEAGNSGDAALTALTASENGSGMIPEQVWDNAAPSGYTPGTPTKSMDPLNWAMGEFITLLFSASTGTVADQPAIVYNRYVAHAFKPQSGQTIDYDANQAQAGKALTIYYDGSLDSQSHIDLHWGYNSWTSPQDVQMVKRSDGIWQATISVPSGSTQVNMAFNNDNGTWDNNGSLNYNITIGAVSSSPNPPVAGQSVTITYNGTLASSATSLTMHWGDNNWSGVTNTTMTKQSNGTWTATVTVPSAATVLNMDFYNQSSTWDNNSTYNYDLTVS
jgi:glucoamylase